jgi:hypothetical protein
MLLSLEPPPEANNPWKFGFQAIAFTAAVWLLNYDIGINDLVFQIYSLLSFPPLAKNCSSWDHFNPQTYWVWIDILDIIFFEFSLKSLCNIALSLDSDARILCDQASELTLEECPYKVSIFLFLSISHIYIFPKLFPIAMWLPFVFQTKLDIFLFGEKSHYFWTLLYVAFHKYAKLDNPIANIFWADQSKRLR